MARVDAFASEEHYLAHIAPVWSALPCEIRGTLYSTLQAAKRVDQTASIGQVDGTLNDRPCLVASFRDLQHARNRRRKIILMEHGAGQSYSNASSYYAGGHDRENVIAALFPNVQSAARHALAHPTIPARVVGCPRLDIIDQRQIEQKDPVPAISFHWDCKVVNETRTALPHFKPGFNELKTAFPHVVGHAHPRIVFEAKKEYQKAGIKWIDQFESIVNLASVYIADNTSTMFEFAAFDRPVVVMNAPWYRRDVEHGGRFWRWANVGVQVNAPQSLVAAVSEALSNDEKYADRRRQIIAEVYPFRGSSINRVVESICDIVGG